MFINYKWNVEDALASGKISPVDLNFLQEWSKDLIDLPSICDQELICLLCFSNGNLNLAQKSILGYLRLKKMYPEQFLRDALPNEKIKNVLSLFYASVSKEFTKDGCTVITLKLQDTRFWKYTFELQMLLCFICIDLSWQETIPEGLIFLFDCDGFGFMHLTRINLNVMKNFVIFAQEALPVKLKAIHIMNVNSFIVKFWNMLAPCFNEQLTKKLFLHPKTINLDEFHLKFIAKEFVTTELGGFCNYPDLHQNTYERLLNLYI